MPDTDEVYFRKWLNDNTTVVQDYVPETDVIQPTETADTTYLRKYLNDPITVSQDYVHETDP
jgi:hypothetical protein